MFFRSYPAAAHRLDSRFPCPTVNASEGIPLHQQKTKILAEWNHRLAAAAAKAFLTSIDSTWLINSAHLPSFQSWRDCSVSRSDSAPGLSAPFRCVGASPNDLPCRQQRVDPLVCPRALEHEFERQLPDARVNGCAGNYTECRR